MGGQTVQRIILPAAPSCHPVQTASSASIATPTTLATLRPTLQTATAGLTQLPPGTTLLTPSTTLQGLQGFALVPAQYVTQVSLSCRAEHCLLLCGRDITQWWSTGLLIERWWVRPTADEIFFSLSGVLFCADSCIASCCTCVFSQ